MSCCGHAVLLHLLQRALLHRTQLNADGFCDTLISYLRPHTAGFYRVIPPYHSEAACQSLLADLCTGTMYVCPIFITLVLIVASRCRWVRLRGGLGRRK
jgi:hypothetical protein